MEQEQWERATVWAEEQFGQVELGDVRRTRRLVQTAAKIAQQPQGSLPSKFDWNDLRGVYRLMNRPEATHEQIAGPHFRQVRREMVRQPVVLVVHDTTELDFTSHRALRGSGPSGSGGRGFLQHNSLAVTPEGRLLGLAFQQVTLRKPAPVKETSAQRRRRTDRESRLWLEGLEGVGPAPEGCVWVDVGDRGADLFDAMHRSLQLGHQFLFRACQDRKALVGPPGAQRETYLLQHVRSLAPQAFSTHVIASQGGRPARQAELSLAAAEVWVCPPWPESKRKTARPPLRVWVERIWEPTPPAGHKPLEWVLLSSLPVEGETELRQRQAWYERRWPTAEEFHQVEKTGCGEEDLRFESVEAMRPMLALLSIVAVRILQLRQAERLRPDDPATSVASPQEIAMVAAASKKPLSPTTMTVREFVRGVARLGGFLDRRRDGPPGWKTLWRGYQRLQAMIEGAQLSGFAPPPIPHPPRAALDKQCW